MDKNRKIFIASLMILSLVLLDISSRSSLNITSAQPVVIERGETYEIIDNQDGTKTLVAGLPEWVWNGTEYVPYIYQDNFTSD